MNVKFCIQVIFQNFFMMENDLHSFFTRISNNVLFFAMDMLNIARGNIYLHLDNFDPGMDLKFELYFWLFNFWSTGCFRVVSKSETEK